MARTATETSRIPRDSRRANPVLQAPLEFASYETSEQLKTKLIGYARVSTRPQSNNQAAGGTFCPPASDARNPT